MDNESSISNDQIQSIQFNKSIQDNKDIVLDIK